MEKNYCDECKKEIKKEQVRLNWSKESFFDYKYWNKEFCSTSCLISYMKRIGWLK